MKSGLTGFALGIGLLVLSGCSASKKDLGGITPAETPIVIATSDHLLAPPNCEPPILKDPQTGTLVLGEDPAAPLMNFNEEQ
ncbi:hypothetical protein EBQ90_06650 [bacterium]|nr:hypothetical protein [bacterium]